MEHFPTTEKGKWQYFSAAVAEPSQCGLDCVQLRSGSGSAVHQQCRMTRRQTCAKGRQIVWNFQPSELESDALPLRRSSNGKTRNSAKRSTLATCCKSVKKTDVKLTPHSYPQPSAVFRKHPAENKPERQPHTLKVASSIGQVSDFLTCILMLQSKRQLRHAHDLCTHEQGKTLTTVFGLRDSFTCAIEAWASWNERDMRLTVHEAVIFDSEDQSLIH